MDQDQICEQCGVPLAPSQYARKEKDGIPNGEYLVCRNYPACPKAEKEVPTGTGQPDPQADPK